MALSIMDKDGNSKILSDIIDDNYPKLDKKDKTLKQFRDFFYFTDIDALIQDHAKGRPARVFCHSYDMGRIKAFKENLGTDLKIEYVAIDKLHRYRPKGLIAKLLFSKKRNFFKLGKWNYA